MREPMYTSHITGEKKEYLEWEVKLKASLYADDTNFVVTAENEENITITSYLSITNKKLFS